MKKNAKKYEFGKKDANLTANEQKLVDVLKKGAFQCCNGEVTFIPKSVKVKNVNGSKAVVVKWDQETQVMPGFNVPLTGIAGFYIVKGNELKVINFDSNNMFLNDIAGVAVEAIAALSGCTTNYNRKDPDTFKVVYI